MGMQKLGSVRRDEQIVTRNALSGRQITASL
jgi:hypothetical protein